MSKLIFTTDFHLSHRQYGLKEREQDYYQQYHNLIKEIIREKPDAIFILGDTYHTTNPKPISIKHFTEGMKKLQQQQIPIYMIIGNHTKKTIKDYYSIDQLYNNEYYTILNETTEPIDNETIIGGLNHHSPTQDIKPLIDDLYEQMKHYKTKILLLHQSLKEDMPLGYDYDEDKLELDRFDYIMLGHYHKKILRKKEDGTIYHYVGALNSLTNVELNDEIRYGRGYTVLYTDTGELVMKTLPIIRKYYEYTITDDKLNDDYLTYLIECFDGLKNKPMVQLNIIASSPKDIYEKCKILDEHCLILRTNIIPKKDYKDNDYLNNYDNKPTIKGVIDDMLETKWEQDLCYELYNLLKNNQIENAKALCDTTYKEKILKRR